MQITCAFEIAGNVNPNSASESQTKAQSRRISFSPRTRDAESPQRRPVCYFLPNASSGLGACGRQQDHFAAVVGSLNRSAPAWASPSKVASPTTRFALPAPLRAAHLPDGPFGGRLRSCRFRQGPPDLPVPAKAFGRQSLRLRRFAALTC
jgi:hypothetical protein